MSVSDGYLFMLCLSPLTAISEVAHALKITRGKPHAWMICRIIEKVKELGELFLALLQDLLLHFCFAKVAQSRPSQGSIMGACVSNEAGCACSGDATSCTLKEEGYDDNEGREMKVYINATVSIFCESG